MLNDYTKLRFEMAVAQRPEYHAVRDLEFVYGQRGELPNRQLWSGLDVVTFYHGTWGVPLTPVEI